MSDRTIPSAVQQDLNQSSGVDALLAFVTIEHPDLAAPIRVVSDVLDYVKGGETYQGVVFEWRIATDNESAPYTELVIQNVMREIGQVLEKASDRATVHLEVCSTADFDLTQDPRTEIGSAAAIYSLSDYQLTSVEADVIEVRGRVMLADFSQEPWPSIAATQDRCPGLFR